MPTEALLPEEHGARVEPGFTTTSDRAISAVTGSAISVKMTSNAAFRDETGETNERVKYLRGHRNTALCL